MVFVSSTLVAAVMFLVPFLAQAQEGDPLTEEQIEQAEQEALELDPLEVAGEGWSYEQEITLRIIRQAYNRPRSFKQEDRDEWVCWIQEGTGTHLNYLGCARNGDIWALQPDQGLGRLPTGMGGYGRIQVSTHPVNRWKLERALESLPGGPEFDREFTQMILAGERPPRDIPTGEELDRFAAAYRTVDRMERRGLDEDRQIRAIRSAGLTLARYNRIATLVEIYQSIENEVAERLDRND